MPTIVNNIEALRKRMALLEEMIRVPQVDPDETL